MKMMMNNEMNQAATEEFDTFITESLQDRQSKILVSNAMVQPDFKNNEVLGKVFWCVGYVIRPVELDDGIHTGVILFDDEGTSYSTISAGVAKIVCGWRDAKLEPTWEEPMKVWYEQKSKGQYRYYTVKVDPRARYDKE